MLALFENIFFEDSILLKSAFKDEFFIDAFNGVNFMVFLLLDFVHFPKGTLVK
jgi:hypothetical protein